MRTFTSGFQAEIAKRSITPLWILKCEFASGTKYLSDSVFSIASWEGGITTLPWVGRWATLNEKIDFKVSSTNQTKFELVLLNDNDVSPNLDSILWDEDNVVEAVEISLYVWFDGLNPVSDPPFSLWIGNIEDFKKLNELEYQVNFVDLSNRINKKVGYLFSLEDYPDLETQTIGTMAPIVYGDVDEMVGVGLNLFLKTTRLTDNIDSSQTSFDVDDGSVFDINDDLHCEYERMLVTNRSGNTIWVTRGAFSTIKVSHSRSSVIRDTSRAFTFLVANHPIKNIFSIYFNYGSIKTEVTGTVTKDTGQTGDENFYYPGVAVFSVFQSTYRDLVEEVSPDRYIDVSDNAVQFTVDVNGHLDDASGTYTGTANSLIERPDHVAKHFADTYVSVSNFTSDAGSYFDTNDYKFGGALRKYLSFKENMKNFALQSRCSFKFGGDEIKFNLRQINPSSIKTVNEDSILMNEDFKSSLKIDRSRISDVINFITILYNFNFVTKNYNGNTVFQDTVSISNFGEKERTQDFNDFNLVIDSDMIDDVGDFYLNRYKNKSKQLIFKTTLDQLSLEFGDVITVEHNEIDDADGTYEVVEARITPGTLNRIDSINFKCIAIVE